MTALQMAYHQNMINCTWYGLLMLMVILGLTPDQVAKVPNDDLVLIVRTIGDTTANYVVPASIAKGNKMPMFGGNFVYSSDSRFPSDAPIKIHDRIEVPRY